MTKSGKFLLLCLLAFFSCEQDQKNEVPENIRQTFGESYSDARNAKWSLKEDSYEVDFKINGSRIEAEYDINGKQIQEEAMIKNSELPQEIRNYLDKHYPQYHIGEASIEEKSNSKVYELELLNGFFREIELEFDMEGNLLNKEIFKD